MTYRDDLAKLLDGLETEAHDDDQLDRWVAWLSTRGYSDNEVFDVVYSTVVKLRGKSDAEDFANRVRRRFIWRPGRGLSKA